MTWEGEKIGLRLFDTGVIFHFHRAADGGYVDAMRTMEEWLTSEETGEAFSHCLCCKVPLLEIDAPWLVNKEYLKGECVLEYAICQPCRDDVTDRLSEKSKEQVRIFLEQEIDWKERMKELMMAHDPVSRLDACIACRTPRDETGGYGLSALFDSGGALVTGPLPLLVCTTCIRRMTAAFSEESREVWRNFLELNFDGPRGDGGFPGVI